MSLGVRFQRGGDRCGDVSDGLDERRTGLRSWKLRGGPGDYMEHGGS